MAILCPVVNARVNNAFTAKVIMLKNFTNYFFIGCNFRLAVWYIFRILGFGWFSLVSGT